MLKLAFMDVCQHLVKVNGILLTIAKLLLRAVRLQGMSLHKSYCFEYFCAFFPLLSCLSIFLKPQAWN